VKLFSFYTDVNNLVIRAELLFKSFELPFKN